MLPEHACSGHKFHLIQIQFLNCIAGMHIIDDGLQAGMVFELLIIKAVCKIFFHIYRSPLQSLTYFGNPVSVLPLVDTEKFHLWQSIYKELKKKKRKRREICSFGLKETGKKERNDSKWKKLEGTHFVLRSA